MFEALWLAFFLSPTIWGDGVTIQPGETVIVGPLRMPLEQRDEFGPPVLKRIPYVNRLFRTVRADGSMAGVEQIGVDFELSAGDSDARTTKTEYVKAVEVENGKAVGIHLVREARSEYGPPVLSKIPYLGRLFRTIGWSRETVYIPLMAPLKAGEKPRCKAPDQEEILQALPDAVRAGIGDGKRDDVEFNVETLVDRLEPERFYPLVGAAQLHKAHFKCTVYYQDNAVSRQRAEVVYIDKDRLYLCTGAKDDSEASEAPPPAPRARPCQQTQVQFDVVVAKVNRTAKPNVEYPLTTPTNAAMPFGTWDLKQATAFLEKLCDQKAAQIVAKPTLITLPGQEATFAIGSSDYVFKSGDEYVHQHLGTTITATARIMSSGDVYVRLKSESTRVNGPDPSNGGGVPGFDVSSFETTALVKPGQTWAIVKLKTQERREIVKSVPIFGDILSFKFIHAVGIDEDTVILVTPTVIEPCPCDDAKSDVSLLACFDPRVQVLKAKGGDLPGLIGRVYVMSDTTKGAIEAQGDFLIEAFDMAPVLHGGQPHSRGKWMFAADDLKKLKSRDLIGDGYSLFLPWDNLGDVKDIKLQVVYAPQVGPRCVDEPIYLALKQPEPNGDAIAQCKPESRVVQAQAVSRQLRESAGSAVEVVGVSLADVVRLSKAGVANDIVVRQMEMAKLFANVPAEMVPMVVLAAKQQGVIFVGVDELIHLKEQGVSDELVRVLQMRFFETVRPLGKLEATGP